MGKGLSRFHCRRPSPPHGGASASSWGSPGAWPRGGASRSSPHAWGAVRAIRVDACRRAASLQTEAPVRLSRAPARAPACLRGGKRQSLTHQPREARSLSSFVPAVTGAKQGVGWVGRGAGGRARGGRPPLSAPMSTPSMSSSSCPSSCSMSSSPCRPQTGDCSLGLTHPADARPTLDLNRI